MIDANNLLFFVCTVSTIMATLGALIGSFAVFRLQNIDAEINLLKGIVLDRPFGEKRATLRSYLDFEKYRFIRPIYDVSLQSVNLLKEKATESGAIQANQAFSEDIQNIEDNTKQALTVKKLNRLTFGYSAGVILITQAIAIGANSVVKSENALSLCIFVLLLLALGLWLFDRQLRNLIH